MVPNMRATTNRARKKVNGFHLGNGVFTWGDGSRYEGHFVHNNIHGKGTYKWGDDRQYTGDWKDNKMDG
jgi:hypothetical protein